MEIGTVFGIIFTLILISTITVFGYFVITGIWENMELQQIDEAKVNLKETITDFRLTTGAGSFPGDWSSMFFTMQIPASSEFCFVDPQDPSTHLPGNWEPSEFAQTLIESEEFNLWINYKYGASSIGEKVRYMNVSTDSSGNSENFCVQNGHEIKLIHKINDAGTDTYVEVSLKQ
jgi:hypothetical protein